MQEYAEHRSPFLYCSGAFVHIVRQLHLVERLLDQDHWEELMSILIFLIPDKLICIRLSDYCIENKVVF